MGNRPDLQFSLLIPASWGTSNWSANCKINLENRFSVSTKPVQHVGEWQNQCPCKELRAKELQAPVEQRKFWNKCDFKWQQKWVSWRCCGLYSAVQSRMGHCLGGLVQDTLCTVSFLFLSLSLSLSLSFPFPLLSVTHLCSEWVFMHSPCSDELKVHFLSFTPWPHYLFIFFWHLP